MLCNVPQLILPIVFCETNLDTFGKRTCVIENRTDNVNHFV